jgi:hypothetical protein
MRPRWVTLAPTFLQQAERNVGPRAHIAVAERAFPPSSRESPIANARVCPRDIVSRQRVSSASPRTVPTQRLGNVPANAFPLGVEGCHPACAVTASCRSAAHEQAERAPMLALVLERVRPPSLVPRRAVPVLKSSRKWH